MSDATGAGAVRRLFRHLRTELVKKTGLGHTTAELSAALADRELFFAAPPLTPDLVKAIRAITPQFRLKTDAASRRVWELSQNGSCWGEFEALEPLLESLGTPSRVLDIGPGLGRSVVFFKKKLGWREVPFDLYEGEGEARKYPLLAARSADSFRGDLGALRSVLEHNGLSAYEIVDAAATGGRLTGLNPPYDLVYSFYGVGFHWRIEEFWHEILELLGERGVGVFTVHHDFREFPELIDLPHGYLTFRRILAKDRPLQLLVVCRDASRLAGLVEERRR